MQVASAAIKEEKKQSAQSVARVIAEKRAEIEKINLRLQRLLDSFLDAVIERDEYTAEKTKLMSQKKSLEEQISTLSAGRSNWIEPFTEWILTAKNAGEIAIKGSLQEKRVLAQKVFGSNLVLDCKRARGSCVKPWSALVEHNQDGGMVRAAGFESGLILSRLFGSVRETIVNIRDYSLFKFRSHERSYPGNEILLSGIVRGFFNS